MKSLEIFNRYFVTPWDSNVEEVPPEIFHDLKLDPANKEHDQTLRSNLVFLEVWQHIYNLLEGAPLRENATDPEPVSVPLPPNNLTFLWEDLPGEYKKLADVLDKAVFRTQTRIDNSFIDSVFNEVWFPVHTLARFENAFEEFEPPADDQGLLFEYCPVQIRSFVATMAVGPMSSENQQMLQNLSQHETVELFT